MQLSFIYIPAVLQKLLPRNVSICTFLLAELDDFADDQRCSRNTKRASNRERQRQREARQPLLLGLSLLYIGIGAHKLAAPK